MGRQLRIEYPGALYHVMSHGNGFQWIYKNHEHLKMFKYVLRNVVEKYHVKIHAVVLMKNHYHILLETPNANLSQCMKKLNQNFARLFNINANRKGSVIRGRYKSMLIEKEIYFFNVLRYICQNPVRKKVTKRCEEYNGSYLKWIKDKDFERYFYLEDIKEKFKDKGNWYDSFITWLNNDKESNPGQNSKFKYLLGSSEWLEKVNKRISLSITDNITEKKKYYELRINEEALDNHLKNLSIKEQLDISLYFYANYSSKTIKEICKMLSIKSEAAAWQRLRRYKIALKNNPIKRKIQNQIEEIVLNS